jgi:hypothetical protein
MNCVNYKIVALLTLPQSIGQWCYIFWYIFLNLNNIWTGRWTGWWSTCTGCPLRRTGRAWTAVTSPLSGHQTFSGRSSFCKTLQGPNLYPGVYSGPTVMREASVSVVFPGLSSELFHGKEYICQSQPYHCSQPRGGNATPLLPTLLASCEIADQRKYIM